MLANLRALFGVFVDIMLLRRGPEHLPASPLLLVILLALNYVLYTIAGKIFLPPPPPEVADAWLQQVAALAIILLWFRVAFQLARKPERYVQTMSAIFGANLLSLPTVPLYAALLPYAGQPPGSEQAPAALALLAFIVWFWIVAVLVRIVKSAFEWPWLGAILFVVVSAFGILATVAVLFGVEPKAA